MKKSALTCFTALSLAFATQHRSPVNNVRIVGAMKNVMWKGQLQGTIDLDTIRNKQHLYGLGPVEYLAGELLVIDGRSYRSSVHTDSTMKVEETFKVKAPFFAYTNITKWKEQVLPEKVRNLEQLEIYLDKLTKKMQRPFMFKLVGTVETARIHVVNLPAGTNVTSPDEAHRGQKNYTLTNRESEIIGFFSTEHKAVFTHHDTFLHLHLISTDRTSMGHLDEMVWSNGRMKLYLPAG